MRARSLVLLMVGGAACGPVVPVAAPTPDAERPLPELRVEQVAGGVALDRVPVPRDELEALRRGERVTLTAVGSDLRAVLAALAEAAGVSLVVGPEVQGRVTVHLENVPAREALERVVLESGLMITEPLRAPWGPAVFYVVPVNVNEADAETIRVRFGVSEELARFLVRARVPPH
jgi:type II secretory pathway component GspD/PulD (secretin)